MLDGEQNTTEKIINKQKKNNNNTRTTQKTNLTYIQAICIAMHKIIL